MCLTVEGMGGLSNHWSGAVYQGGCLICEELVAKYWGESRDSGYLHTSQHIQAI